MAVASLSAGSNPVAHADGKAQVCSEASGPRYAAMVRFLDSDCQRAYDIIGCVHTSHGTQTYTTLFGLLIPQCWIESTL